MSRTLEEKTGMPNYNNSRLELLSACIAGVTMERGKCQTLSKIANPNQTQF